MDIQELKDEIENAKDPTKAIVLFLGKHMEDDQTAHQLMMKEITSLKDQLDPITNAFQATGLIRNVGGWIVAFVAGIIIAWDYIISHAKDVFTR